jgi:hypothetical protein
MKAMYLPIVIPFALATLLPADTCREVVRDSSGRIIQTVDRQKQSGGTVQSVTRLAGSSGPRSPGRTPAARAPNTATPAAG